jgi:hypothetical protein
MNKDEFELAFRRHMEEGGHSYDPWDIAWSWCDYQKNPAKYKWLNGGCMKIERDKWYVMRNGEKRRVICVDAPGTYPIIIIGEGRNSQGTRYADGKVYRNGEHAGDLVREHREPKVIYVNEYTTYDVAHRDEEMALEWGV